MSMGPKPFRSLLEEDNSEYYETMKLDTYAGSDPAHYATGLCCQLWRKHSATSSAGATLRAADLFKLLHFCGRKAYPLSIMESSSKYGMTLFSQVFMGILTLWVSLMKQLYMKVGFTSQVVATLNWSGSCDGAKWWTLQNEEAIKSHLIPWWDVGGCCHRLTFWLGLKLLVMSDSHLC